MSVLQTLGPQRRTGRPAQDEQLRQSKAVSKHLSRPSPELPCYNAPGMKPPAAQYVKTCDGLSIAYSVTGRGVPLVLGPIPLTHVQLFWSEHFAASPLLMSLAARYQVIQYDQRGQGMSSRGLRADHTIEDYLKDIDALVEHLGVDRFVLCAGGCTAHVAVHYAVQRSDRVAALVLFSCASTYAAYRAHALFEELPAQDWEMFLRNMAPRDLAPDRLLEYVSMFDQMVTPEDWLAQMRAIHLAEGVEDLLPAVQAPTLVIHARDYHLLPVEESIKTAQLANGRLALIDGASAWGEAAGALHAIEEFLNSLPQSAWSPRRAVKSKDKLSDRELQILKLISLGRSNQQIADHLVISVNTVARHVTSILSKIGVSRRGEAAAYAHQHLIT